MIKSAQKKITAVIALMAALTLALAACSSEDTTETTATFTQEANGVQMSMTYYAKGDKVYKQTTENVINYEEAGLGTKEDAKEILDPLIAEYQDVKGLEHTFEYGDTSATEKMVIDYSVADIAEVSKLTGSEFSGDVSKKSFVSLKQSREMLLKSGFTEVK